MRQLKLYALVTFLISFLGTVWFGPHLVKGIRAQVVPAQVSISPSTQQVILGNQATFDVIVTGASNVAAYEFDLVYDSAVVQVTGATDGSWLDSTGRTVVPLEPDIDNTNGRTTIGAFSFGGQPGASGNGILATVTVSTLSQNTSPITIENLQLVDPNAQTVPSSSTNGTVTVTTLSATPSPSASGAPTPSATLVPSATPHATPSISPTPVATPVSTPIPTSVPSSSPVVVTPTPTPVATPVVPSASPVPTPTPLVSSTPAPSATPVASTNPSSSPVASTQPSTTPVATVSPTPSAQPATLALTTDGAVVEGHDFVVSLALTTTQPVVGVDAVVLFDPRKLSAQSVNDLHLLPLTPGIDINNGSGRIRISQLMPPGQTFTGSGNMAQITFKALALGETQIGFDFIPHSKVESNVIATNGADILGQPSSLALTVIEEGTLQLFLETYSENLTLGYAVSGILTDTESTWSARITTETLGDSNIVPVDSSFIGKVKTLVFKVTGYLTKSFTKTITPGLNSVDLGKLKAGDLNDDGIINTIDLSLLYEQWFGTEEVADFNRDGFVNSADYWVLTQNYLAVDE